MVEELEHKYEVDIKITEKRQKLPDAIKTELKASGMMDDKGKLKLKGVSPKIKKKMKTEFVECPVLKENIQFVQCFICPNSVLVLLEVLEVTPELGVL